MRLRRVASWIGARLLLVGLAGLAGGLGGCVVREAPPVNVGYGYYGYGPPAGYDLAEAGTPTPYEVTSQAPEPLDDQAGASPGDGYDWIGGYWHWNGNDWVWVGGRWEREHDGYVYVEPYYDYSGGRNIYTPGYWSPRGQVPAGWTIRPGGAGRPTVSRPPTNWHNNAPVRPVIGGWRPNGGPATVAGPRPGTYRPTSIGNGGYAPEPQRPRGNVPESPSNGVQEGPNRQEPGAMPTGGTIYSGDRGDRGLEPTRATEPARTMAPSSGYRPMPSAPSSPPPSSSSGSGGGGSHPAAEPSSSSSHSSSSSSSSSHSGHR